MGEALSEGGVKVKPKRKQTAKKGRVVRLTPDLVKLIESRKFDSETISGVLRRLLDEAKAEGRPYFVLPSDLHESLSRARGAAVVRAVRTRKIEKPVVVREVER